jgi:short-subunit dehydrogenase
LVLTGRDGARLTAVAARTGSCCRACDLARPTDVEDLLGWLATAPPPDALVLNAGLGWAGATVDTPAERLIAMVAVNLQAPVRLVVQLLPGMLSRGDGRIVLVSSIAGRLPVREEAVYSATKAGLTAFADSLRWELADTGVTVSVVVPGAVDTGFFARRGRPYDRSRPRAVPPERVADAVARLLVHPVPEVFVPRWLRLPARLNGGLPGLTAALARRLA